MCKVSEESDIKTEDSGARRRRRRKSGLRIPSDHVPRQDSAVVQHSRSSDEITTPMVRNATAPRADTIPDFAPPMGSDGSEAAAITETFIDTDLEEVEDSDEYEVTVTRETVRDSDITMSESVPSSQTVSTVESAPRKKPPALPNGEKVQAATAKPPPAPKPKQWFEEIFDEDYLKTLPFLTPRMTQAEAAFVEDSLGLEVGAQILDLGCGYGRHAMELAARGYHVVALDLALPLLHRGADEAKRRGLSIHFVHQDMRELAFDAQFDGAYCLFSTFGYFDDETNQALARQLSAVLRPGARVAIEVLNRDYLISDLPTRVWWEGDGCVVLEEVSFDYEKSRIVSNRSVVFDDGRQLEYQISVRAYALHEFDQLLTQAGLHVREVSGSIATRGKFFGNQSRDIIVVAEKSG